MTKGQPVGRFQWDDLPTGAQTAVSREFGRVLDVQSAPPGLTVGVASRLTTATGDVWLKAIPSRSPARHHYDRERDVNATLPERLAVPRLLWATETAGWVLLAFEHIPEGHEADLTPGSADIPRVLDTLATLNETLSPSPWPTAPDIQARFDLMAAKARAALADPPADPADGAMYAAALDGLNLDATRGDCLLHGDLHPGNLLITPKGIVILDWSLAAQGTPWIDAARLVPRLVADGHNPAQAEALASQLPAFANAPGPVVTGLAAVWTLFAFHLVTHGPDRLRAHRQRSMQSGTAWLRHRMGWDSDKLGRPKP